MAGNSKDSKILEYKDMINQLNKTIAAQTELIQSLPKTLEEYRLEKEKPILDAFWNWLEQQRPNKGTRLAKAVNYAQNRKDTLMTYLEDGHCSLSNNLSENAICPFTVGRKNWLFSASPKGATASSIVYTMVEMAKTNDLNTYKYLTYLLSQRSNDKMSDEQLEQLAPWSETVKANCQN